VPPPETVQIAGDHTRPTIAPRQYYARLDGLRGVAVLLVLMEHFTYSELIRGWSPGMIGVRLFFVLSGFLITSILLGQKSADSSRRSQAAAFYWRRFVRLSPAMFVAVGLMYLLDVAQMRQSWWIHLFYLSNFQIADMKYWIPASHFWSLSVEEQFYLLWFPLVVLAPKRLLLPTILLFVAGAPLYRMMIPFGMNEFYNVLLPGQVDSLAWGALIAVVKDRPALRWFYRLLGNPRVLWASLTVTLLALNPFVGHAMIAWPISPALVSLTGASLVINCVEAQDRTFAWLAAPLLVHIGIISYGIYVYHYFIPQVIYTHANDLHVWLSPSVWTKLLRTAFWLALTFIAAEVSWWFLERPMLRLKSLVKAKRAESIVVAEQTGRIRS
jgi:peptidoglycan/LPS O-acetylase OafA/YrhL